MGGGGTVEVPQWEVRAAFNAKLLPTWDGKASNMGKKQKVRKKGEI